ncbi:unnamed protein product, partial [Lampetra planeri]
SWRCCRSGAARLAPSERGSRRRWRVSGRRRSRGARRRSARGAPSGAAGELEREALALRSELSEREQRAAPAPGDEEVEEGGEEEGGRLLREEVAQLRGELEEERRAALARLATQRQQSREQLSALREDARAQAARLQEALDAERAECGRVRAESRRLGQAAREHHATASRLLAELARLQGDFQLLHAQLRSQEELASRERETREALRAVRSDVREEIGAGLRELDRSRLGLLDDLEAVYEEKERVRREIDGLKENLPPAGAQLSALSAPGGAEPATAAIITGPPRSPGLSRSLLLLTKGELWSGDAACEKLRQQDDWLKVELRQRMSRQAEALSSHRVAAEGTLRGLQRRVDALGHLVANNGGAPPGAPHPGPPTSPPRPGPPKSIATENELGRR